MFFVAERVLPSYVAALERSLDEAVDHLPAGRLRIALIRLRRRLGRDRAHFRFGALSRLATIAEAHGWLRPEEAIVIEKLAYRVAFYARRAGQEGDERREARDGSVVNKRLRTWPDGNSKI